MSGEIASARASSAEVGLRELNNAYSEQNTKYIRALAQIAKIEQAHCYSEAPDSEVNEIIQTRFDLRTCGDTARAALGQSEAKP